KERALIALYISLFVVGFLTFFYFSGLSLLEFFGISLPAFRIAGGVILFLLGLEMARDDFTATFADAAEAASGDPRQQA
ncbi:MarC family protein, partial [Salmonella enterica]|uniref:MarC family protein n=1 Tax=Salmonella enterica TaxID=28901 RepID=UPI003CF96FA6